MESHWLSKTSELASVQTELDLIHYKSSMFTAHYDKIKSTVIETMQNQLHEYMSSVNNKPNYGIDLRLPVMFEQLQAQVDSLITSVDETIENSNKFKEEYTKQI